MKAVNASNPEVGEQLWQYYSDVSSAFANITSLNPNHTNITDIMNAIASVMRVQNNQSHGEAFVFANSAYYQFTSTSPYSSYTYSS